MNDLSEEIFKWNFDKIPPKEWQKKIVEELERTGEIPSFSPPYFFTSADAGNSISLELSTSSIHQNITRKIWSGVTINVNVLEESYDKIIGLLNRGSNQVNLKPSSQIDSNKGLIQLVEKIAGQEVRINIDFTGIKNEVIFQVLQEDFVKILFEKKIIGSFIFDKEIILDGLQEVAGLFHHYPFSGFHPFNIDFSDLKIGEIISLGVLLLEKTDAILNKLLFPGLEFSLSIGNDYFYEISKGRALRFLWRNIERIYSERNLISSSNFNAFILHDATSTIEHEEVLKATTRSMAALLGGYGSLMLTSSELAGPRELARTLEHIPLILLEEAGIGQTADPLKGSYYIEYQSRMLAEEGWNLFCDIEKKGGYAAYLKNKNIEQEN